MNLKYYISEVREEIVFTCNHLYFIHTEYLKNAYTVELKHVYHAIA